MNRLIHMKRLQFYLWLGLGYFLLATLSTMGTYPGKFFPLLVNNLWAVVYVTFLNYLLFEAAVPFILRKSKQIILNILVGLLLLFIFMILFSYGSYLWRLLGIKLGIYTILKVFDTLKHLLANQMGYSVGSVFFFGITRHIFNYIRLRQTTQQLRIEKQEAELNYLRSQTNPHFLFNTLNNIYSLARDKSDLAPESILRLSKILRFMLYEAGGEYISIEQEMKIIDDYMALEKLRYDESLRVTFKSDIEDKRQALPPLLLIPLVENAFKHGASETRGEPFVDMYLSVNNRQLTFVVKNSAEEPVVKRSDKESIGLSNLRRQLELLYKNYDLSVKQDGPVFTATLKINLASHA
jgi:two-component system, LytTR family, sensor kinase